MSILIPIAVTVAAAVYIGAMYAGNKGSFHNYMDPSADWLLVGAAVMVAVVWIFYGVLR